MQENKGTPEKNELTTQNQPEPSTKTELTTSLEQIDSEIIERFIYGKFQGPVFLHGQQVLDSDFNRGKGSDYTFAPGDRNQKTFRKMVDPTGQFSTLNGLVRTGVHDPRNASELENTLAISHVFGYLIDENKADESTLVLIYPYEFYDSAKRPALTTEVCLKLPTESLKQLLGIVRENPDALEQFYQIATAGLDPSVKRYQSSQLAIVDLNTFMPFDKFEFPNIGPDIKPDYLHQMVSLYQDRLNLDGLTFLQYSSPYGSVDKKEAEKVRELQKQIVEERPIQIPKAATSQPKIIPAALDNPSGLNPDAPLTKLINAGIRLFKPKTK